MHGKRGEIQNYRKLIGKIRHAATAVPTGEKMMTPINKILQVKLRIVGWKYFPSAKQAFQDWRTLLKEAAHGPATEKVLVMGDPEFLGLIDASGEGFGGGLNTIKYALEPTIWRLGWPKTLRDRLITPTNSGGELDINDMGMEGKLLS